MSLLPLPATVLPTDGRFGCGPSKIRSEQFEAFVRDGSKLMGTSHRQAPVKNLVGTIRTGLADLFRLPDGYEVVLGNGGSTAFWDAAAFGIIEHKSAHLSIGEFSHKFAIAAGAPWLEAPAITTAEVGTSAPLALTADADVYAWPHNETSTGVMTAITRPAGADPAALTVVDATSAAGGIDFDIEQADVYYFAPQKNFGSDGGLWFALMSPRAIERVERIAASGRYIPASLDLKTALTNSRLNQTLNTPAIATLFFMANQVEWINSNGGLAWADARTKASSGILYDWAERDARVTPFVAAVADRSQVVVTIDFDATIDAAAVAATLRANGIVDVEPYRKLGRNQLRIATFVSIDPEDVATLVTAIEYVLDRLA